MDTRTPAWWDNQGQVRYTTGTDPAQRIEYLLLQGKKPWEKKLFQNEGRSVDASSRLNYLRYPMELLNTPSYMSAMVFEIYNTDPEHLKTTRSKLGKITENISQKFQDLVDNRKKSQEETLKVRAGESFSFKFGDQNTEQFAVQLKNQDGTPSGKWQIVDGGSTTYTAEELGNLMDTTSRDKFLGPRESAAGDIIQNLVSVGGSGVSLLAELGENVLFGNGNPLPDMNALGWNNEKQFAGHARDTFVEEVTGFKGGTKDVGARIYLYLPENIETEYGFEYEDTNMAALDITRLAKALSQNGDKAGELSSTLGRKLALSNVKAAEGFMKQFPGLGNVIDDNLFTKSLEAGTRQIVNPMAMHLFKEVKRRTFTFNYTFLPKSNQEMLNCYRIIHLFKYYAHPSTSGNGRFLDYPAEFNIKFYQKNSSNNDVVSGYLPYIFKCALTGIKVTYGEEQVMSTFMPDVAGAPPTKIVMELQFSELEILTRDRFGSNDWMPQSNVPQP
jgi:hypothetical protein